MCRNSLVVNLSDVAKSFMSVRSCPVALVGKGKELELLLESVEVSREGAPSQANLHRCWNFRAAPYAHNTACWSVGMDLES